MMQEDAAQPLPAEPLPAQPLPAEAAKSSSPASIFKKVVSVPLRLGKAVLGTTYGTILLAQHMKNVMGEQITVGLQGFSFPSEISRELRHLENLSAHLRWLRGLLTAFGVASFVLSLLVILMEIQKFSWAILGLSIAALVVLFRIYQVKAVQVSLTNSLYRDRANIIVSPYFYQMIGEMLLWCVQCPPGFENHEPYNMLGFVCFLRVYTLVMYVNNATLVHRTFCRAMSAFCGVPLSNSFFIRTSLIYYKLQAGSIVVTCCWLTLALMFSVSEHQRYNDSLWFIFVTVGTIGYGDISPITTVGRITALLAWIFSLICIGYMVVLTHDTLSLKDHERSLYVLFRSNELSVQQRDEAAQVIQSMWRFYKSKKSKDFLVVQNFLGWLVIRQVHSFKEHRLQLRGAARLFRDAEDKAAKEVLGGKFKTLSPQREELPPNNGDATSPKLGKLLPSTKCISSPASTDVQTPNKFELFQRIETLEAKTRTLASLLSKLEN